MNKVLIIALLTALSTGCATWDVQRDVGISTERVGDRAGEVVNAVPDVIAGAAAAAIFGGQVTVQDPVGHVAKEADREFRYLFNRSRRAVTDDIRGAFPQK